MLKLSLSNKVLCAAVVVWIALCILSAILVHSGKSHWIELFNGATWPEKFNQIIESASSGTNSATSESDGAVKQLGIGFFAAVGARTFLNLGVSLSAMVGVYWVITGGLQMLKGQLAAISKSRDMALAAEILRVFAQKEIRLPNGADQVLMRVAKGFSESELGRRYDEMRDEHSDE